MSGSIQMAEPSSRIFVKGLPPSFTDQDFRKHFSQHGREITDAKIFPNRRIGYVGYKTPDDAQKAVKYFNRTFIRMSKISVELARPIQQSAQDDPVSKGSRAPTATLSFRKEEQGNEPKRKRDDEAEAEQDPKLKEFLEAMKPASKRRVLELGAEPQGTLAEASTKEQVAIDEVESDDEYEEVPRKSAAKNEPTDPQEEPTVQVSTAAEAPKGAQAEGERDDEGGEQRQKSSSDIDWMRNRTSRLLGLLDDDEEQNLATPRKAQDTITPTVAEGSTDPDIGAASKAEPLSSIPTPPSDNTPELEEVNADVETVRSTMRLFLRNLSYQISKDDIEAEFASFGNLEERDEHLIGTAYATIWQMLRTQGGSHFSVHVAMDLKSGKSKGFAYIQFSDPDSAVQAFLQKDGRPFQGRLLHVLPASAKRETKLGEFDLSKLPVKKQQQIKKRREAASSTFNWNALYMNPDAVVSSIVDRLGLSKSEVLDPTSSDAAVKQAHAETYIIQETKEYFGRQGVDLDAFKKSQRGDTAILVKNIPYDCSRDELKRLFEAQGDVKRFIMPPSGVIAIIEFSNAAQTKAAFGALAYRKVKSSVLFLEKAPKDIFNGGLAKSQDTSTSSSGISKVAASDLKHASDQVVPESTGRATLFVRNLNFTTTTATLTETFKPLDGFSSARVKTKVDPKRPGQILSMGFGFLEFYSSKQAQAALEAMDGFNLEGHKLQIRASHKGADAAEETRRADAAKEAAGKKTKVVIKNLPFEANKKDIRALFSAYGQLRSVRVPKKMDRGARGFAFADFTTAKEAESAINALKDTHLLGRKLVLDFAAEDPEDAEAEIKKMQQKVGSQVNKVALQKLTSGGRKKFTTQQDEE
ncbi:RNA-binding domain-containing protein [Polychaeton citri CBS 116435]|uniref:Multiple RNA-binding domain-containing protein 1 n=1 Tax=Polychaeton citri CBS 116435 TaxID=1314669 RepID=A0A9P4Q4H6_9PEZI|nr:RNA-binding domain-containing protein [Polychaeton citri CBS 116435]